MMPQTQAMSHSAQRAAPGTASTAHALALVEAESPGTDDHALAARMREVVGRATYKEIARATGTHPETVRRYFLAGRPSVSFLGAFCAAYRDSADWLLDGMGERQRDARTIHPAREHVEIEPTEASDAAAPPRPTVISGRARAKRT
jgi:hypothetical protein